MPEKDSRGGKSLGEEIELDAIKRWNDAPLIHKQEQLQIMTPIAGFGKGRRRKAFKGIVKMGN